MFEKEKTEVMLFRGEAEDMSYIGEIHWPPKLIIGMALLTFQSEQVPLQMQPPVNKQKGKVNFAIDAQHCFGRTLISGIGPSIFPVWTVLLLEQQDCISTDLSTVSQIILPLH